MSIEPTCNFCGASDKFRCRTKVEAAGCASFVAEASIRAWDKAEARVLREIPVKIPLGNKPIVETDPSVGITHKSDGGSTLAYYGLPDHATELNHLMSAKGMSFARGNIFKACYRLGEKSGTDILYDINKIRFFAEELLEMYNRGERI